MIVDLNGLQQYGWRSQDSDRFDRSEPQGHVDLPAVFGGFGWNVLEVDGHDLAAIREAYDGAAAGRGVAGRPTVDRRPHHQGRRGVVHGGQLPVAQRHRHRRGARPRPPRARASSPPTNPEEAHA